ncbi:MAG: hypothetical protein ACH34X_07420 [Thiolinea sp.]
MAKPVGGKWLEDSIHGLTQFQIDKVISKECENYQRPPTTRQAHHSL